MHKSSKRVKSGTALPPLTQQKHPKQTINRRQLTTSSRSLRSRKQTKSIPTPLHTTTTLFKSTTTPKITTIPLNLNKNIHKNEKLTENDQNLKTNEPNKQISSIYDLSFDQFQSIFTQTNRLKFKVDPLFSMAHRQLPPSIPSGRGGASATATTFKGQKPLADSDILLVHSLSTRKSKHNEVLKSNLAHIPGLLGAKSLIIADQNVVDIETTKKLAQESFCKKYNLDSILLQYNILISDPSQTISNKLSDDRKIKKRSKKTSDKEKTEVNEETIYDEKFLSLLSSSQQSEFKQYQDNYMTELYQTKVPNVSLKEHTNPFDLVVNISTLERPVNFQTILSRLHPPSSSLAVSSQHQTTHSHTNTNTNAESDVIISGKQNQLVQNNQDGPSKSFEKKKTFSSSPTVTIQSEYTSLLSLLTIFSLLPRETLINNPNSLKISYIGYDYGNNTNFVPELIYLCRRFGVNLSLSTPSISTQFTDMKIFEQSCLAIGKPIPISQKKKKKNSDKKNKKGDGDDDGGSDLENDPNVINIDEDLYDDLNLLEPNLFIKDPSPGLSPHSTNVEQIKQYKKHLDSLNDGTNDNQNQQNMDPNHHQSSYNSADGPESFEEASALGSVNGQNGSGGFTPATALQMIKNSGKTTTNSNIPINSNPFSRSQPQLLQQSNNGASTTTLNTVGHSPGTKIPIQPALIEYSHHPFIAVQNADFIITNTIFPATTHSYMEHPSFELDKEMCSFAKDTMKIFHVTEGISNWDLPPLGVHDPRCMLEQQVQAEGYVLAALGLVLTGKEVH